MIKIKHLFQRLKRRIIYILNWRQVHIVYSCVLSRVEVLSHEQSKRSIGYGVVHKDSVYCTVLGRRVAQSKTELATQQLDRDRCSP